jgi:hypothetical protein
MDFQKIVATGLNIALDGGVNSFMAKLHNSSDPIGDVVRARCTSS